MILREYKKSKPFRSLVAWMLVTGWAGFAIPRCQADWPGLLGANRDGHAADGSTLASSVPNSPKVLWELPAGQGYAGASIASGYACLFDRQGSDDRVRWVEVSTGKVEWTAKLPAKYAGGINDDKGPRCVPSIVSDRIVLYSAAGDLTCLAKKDGSILWTRSLKTEYKGDDGYFGAGSTPLVLEDRIVVNAGGKKGGIVCLSLADGATLWTATAADASYASPIRLSGELSHEVVVPTRLVTYGIDSKSGQVLWEVPFGQRGPTVNAATPIALSANRLFLTASYGIGHLRLDIKNGNVTTEKGELMSSQYSTPVFCSGKIFGTDGREDFRDGSYKCLSGDAKRLLWEESNMPICHSIVVGNRILIVGIDGRLWSLPSEATGFVPEWKSALPGDTYRALPAYDGSLLLVRSSNRWLAVELGK